MVLCSANDEWHVVRLTGLKDGTEYCIAVAGERDSSKVPPAPERSMELLEVLDRSHCLVTTLVIAVVSGDSK